MSLVVLASSRTVARAIVHPRHASEIAGIVKAPPTMIRGGVAVQRTSLTVGVSTAPLGSGNRVLYALSRADRRLTAPEARALARLIGYLVCRSGGRQELLCGNHGVFHLIVHQTRG